MKAKVRFVGVRLAQESVHIDARKRAFEPVLRADATTAPHANPLLDEFIVQAKVGETAYKG